MLNTRKHKKIFILPLLLAVFGLGVLTFTAQAQAIRYVDIDCPNGVATYDPAGNVCTGGNDTVHNSIKNAFAAASAGDRIQIRGGSYPPSNLWNNSGDENNWIRIEPYNSEEVIIDMWHGGSYDTDGTKAGLDIRSSSYIWIDGLTLTATDPALQSVTEYYPAGDGAMGVVTGIQSGGSFQAHHIKITNNTFHDIPMSGVLIKGADPGVETQSHNIIIEGNTFSDIGLIRRGYHVYNAGDDSIIRNNTMFHAYGIGVKVQDARSGSSADRNIVEGNIIHGNGHINYWHAPAKEERPVGSGVYVLGGTDNIIRNNVIYDNFEHGIAEWPRDGANNIYINNTVYNNGLDGISWGLDVHDFDYMTDYNQIVANNIVYGNQNGNMKLAPGVINNNNLTGDPFFLDEVGDNFRLTASSTNAIDQGTNTDCPPVDIDGNPRPYNGTCDIGAYEYQGVTADPADVNSDGFVNSTDIQACVNIILEIVTVPPIEPAVIVKAKAVAEPLDICDSLDLQAILNEILK